MENFNAEQIKKALECCHKDSNCDGCMYGKYRRKKNGTCIELMQRDALALINEQEQRIKELEAECKKWQSRLEIECEYTKADTVRKMQELIYERLDISVEGYSSEEIKSDVRDMVYQIAKELLEGKDEIRD